MKRIIIILSLLLLFPAISKAEVKHSPASCCFREEENCGQYSSLEIEVSAYYPQEDSKYPNNWKGKPLTELVGEIVAVPNKSNLINETLYIEGVGYRIADDKGCPKGRVDLLVSDKDAMNKWGLRNKKIWIIE